VKKKSAPKKVKPEIVPPAPEVIEATPIIDEPTPTFGFENDNDNGN
jgi:hypothetical protein